MNPSSLLHKLNRFAGTPILVIGDLMVDRYLTVRGVNIWRSTKLVSLPLRVA